MRQLAKKSWQFGTPIAPAKIWQKLTYPPIVCFSGEFGTASGSKRNLRTFVLW